MPPLQYGDILQLYVEFVELRLVQGLAEKSPPADDGFVKCRRADNSQDLLAHPAGEDKTSGGFSFYRISLPVEILQYCFGLNQRNPTCIKALLV